ncbi:hypothetical protein RJT34_20346 [Clitoria ternatea]|uniref:Uncharacterized protein n=1 Tax=Clitoria ternatea TaxID=43366 RepID=A0AAN9ISN6_CLITE
MQPVHSLHTCHYITGSRDENLELASEKVKRFCPLPITSCHVFKRGEISGSRSLLLSGKQNLHVRRRNEKKVCIGNGERRRSSLAGSSFLTILSVFLARFSRNPNTLNFRSFFVHP